MINYSCSELTAAVLDAIHNQIAVIDRQGTIHYVNQAWIDFGKDNGVPSNHSWINTSYVNACLLAAQGGDQDGAMALDKIRSVLEGRSPTCSYEYPCHSPSEPRWFMMQINPIRSMDDFFVVTHHLITERKLAEELVEQQNHQLEKLATTDRLTQLLNRLRLDEKLEEEIERANRYGTDLSIVMVDVDYFKAVNDNFGHRSGDVVLRGIAELMRNNVRRSDSVGRWGGEEFLILMPDCDAGAAEQLADKLRIKTANHAFPNIGVVTCSYGVAQYKSAHSVAQLIEIADVALYQAKSNGRNCVARNEALDRARAIALM